jgi:hypothetical protein
MGYLALAHYFKYQSSTQSYGNNRWYLAPRFDAFSLLELTFQEFADFAKRPKWRLPVVPTAFRPLPILLMSIKPHPLVSVFNIGKFEMVGTAGGWCGSENRFFIVPSLIAF